MAEENGAERTSLETCEADVEAPRPIVVRRTRTFESFGHRDFSLFWGGSLLSNMGSWMQTAALGLVVWSFRSSELDLGIVNFMTGIPVLVLALPAGLLADRVDRRKLLMAVQAVLLVQATALGVLFHTGHLSSRTPVLSLVYVSALGLVGGIASALTFPAWQSLLPDLVPRKSLLNAIALNSAQFQGARLLGPLAAGGILLLGADYGQVFYVNAASFLFVIGALWFIRPHPSNDGLPGSRAHTHARVADGHREGPWATLTAGMRYARANRTVGTLIITTAVMTVFGMPFLMLLPAIADKVLGHPEVGYTYLMSANGAGALVGALVVASLPHTVKRERLIPLVLAGMAVLLIALGLSRSFWLSMVLSVFAGAAFLGTNSLTNTTIQAAAPGHLRGRVMALFVMSFMGIMPISAIIFGAIGKAIGPANAVLVGAVVLLGWALVLIARPSLLGPAGEAGLA
ncbi:MAG: MFS transporter [Actinomycetota bacterium]|nr:MFS transporter [Actinomycetota bacterium]